MKTKLDFQVTYMTSSDYSMADNDLRPPRLSPVSEACIGMASSHPAVIVYGISCFADHLMCLHR